MSSNDVATNQNTGSDQKSDANKQQDQAGSGTDDSQQINGKNVIGKEETSCFSLHVKVGAFLYE
jgi:hypothetical protein